MGKDIQSDRPKSGLSPFPRKEILKLCLNLLNLFLSVSSLAYPNLLGKKGYVVVVVAAAE